MTQCSHPQSGVALVEFALVLPVLLVLTVATTEIGRALYEFNTVAKAVRNAARYMSMQDPADAAAVPIAQNLVVFGRPSADDSAAPIAPGLSMSNVPTTNITWSTTGTNPSINFVTVAVTNYTFTPMISNIFGLQIGGDDGAGIVFPRISASMRGQL
jgi:Flp pilus assembly protein TadG